ncbi:hypothetical protein CANMA_000727 [Candida margitis]|uniref:uncharacterized protein n=1 Tax=Candida margitis TaxID=1775924 RepID=UPI00222754A3|nr:uncharacterized protein CANMA_000727 [Candida margitis]KAI5970116.1 hypothetical protein CANMA_000727 [Candida margitis]
MDRNIQFETTRAASGQSQGNSSPNYHYGNYHRRSDSVDFGRRGSTISMLSLQHSIPSNTNTPPTSPQNQYRPNFVKQRQSLEQLQSPLDLVPESQMIDLDRITQEYRRQQRVLNEAEIKWCNFLKEMPVETQWRAGKSSVNLPETSEMLLNKFNSDYNISDSCDTSTSKENALRRALGRFRNSSRALVKLRAGSNRDERSR